MKLFKKNNFRAKAKKVLIVSAWAIMAGSVITLMSFVSRTRSILPCSQLLININNDHDLFFIGDSDIRDLLNSRGKKLIGKPMSDINNRMLENIVYTNPFVSKAEVFSTIDGKVNISIRQRNPVLRIINQNGEDFYVDEQGNFMPVSVEFTANVVTANGFINDMYAEQKVRQIVPDMTDSVTERKMIDQLFAVAMFMQKNEFWNSFIEQMYVNEQQEIELVPRIGDHLILLGDISNMEQKFEKLLVFYKQGLNKTGWNNYELVNLKYKNQVVCTKKNKIQNN